MRRIKKARISYISLCPQGANKLPVIYKGDGDDGVVFDALVKASDDLGEITAIVYAAEHRDAQGDIASAEVIRDMAHEFQKDGGQIDLQHDGKPVGKDRAYVAESFLVQKDDPRFEGLTDRDGQPVDPVGAWATVIKIDDPELRRLYREGEWGGVSMAGRAEVVAEKEEAPGWFTKALRALGLAAKTQPEIDMNKDELVEVLKEQFAVLAEALKPEPADVEKQDDAPEEVDVAELQKQLKEQGDLIQELKDDLAKQAEAGRKTLTGSADESLSDFEKELRDAEEVGKRVAALVNSNR